MATFPGVDYMDIDSLFSEEELMVRQTVRDFVDEEVLPIIAHANREENFPMPSSRRCAEMVFSARPSKTTTSPPQPRGLRPDHAGAERGDSGLAPSFLPPVGTGHVSDLHVWIA